MKKLLTLIAIVSMLVTTDSNGKTDGSVGTNISTQGDLFGAGTLYIQNISGETITLKTDYADESSKSMELEAGKATRQGFAGDVVGHSYSIKCFAKNGSPISCKGNVVLLEDCTGAPCVKNDTLGMN